MPFQTHSTACEKRASSYIEHKHKFKAFKKYTTGVEVNQFSGSHMTTGGCHSILS